MPKLGRILRMKTQWNQGNIEFNIEMWEEKFMLPV